MGLPVCVTQHRVFLALPSPLPREFCCVRMNQQNFPSFKVGGTADVASVSWLGPVVSLLCTWQSLNIFAQEMPSCKAGR